MSFLGFGKKTKQETKPPTSQSVVIHKSDNTNVSVWNDVSVIFSSVGVNGDRWEYTETMTQDDNISRNLDIINNNVLALNRGFAGDSEKVEFIEKCFNNIGFNQYLKNLLQARTNGFSLFEPVFKLENLKYELDRMILLKSSTVNFEIDKFSQLEKISVGGLYYALNKFWLFTNEPTTENQYYGTSILSTIFREWDVKNALDKLELIGIENYALPIHIFNYLKTVYPPNSQELQGLNALLNFKGGSRMLSPAMPKNDGGLIPTIEVTKMEVDAKGLPFIRIAIEDRNKAINRNMGIPAEFDNVANGNNAKMVTVDKMHGREISAIALPLEYNVQQLTDIVLAMNFEGYKKGDVLFTFDFNTDRGLTKEKAETLKMLFDSGTLLTNEAKAQFLDIPEVDFAEAKVAEVVEEFASKNKTETFEVKSGANIKRIKKRLDDIEAYNVTNLSDNIKKQTIKMNVKLQKGTNSIIDKRRSGELSQEQTDKIVNKSFGDMNERNNHIFLEVCCQSYVDGMTEALSELEKKKGFKDVETFEYSNEIETFEAGGRYKSGNWIKNWLRRKGIKIKSIDANWIKRASDFAWTASQDLDEKITKIYRHVLNHNMGKTTNNEIIAMINERISTAGLLEVKSGKKLVLPSYHLNTSVKTASSIYFNNGRQSLFLDKDLIDSGFMRALKFTAVMDSVTTAVCAEHDGMIIGINDPMVAEFSPPLHMNCRSIFEPITEFEYNPKMVNFVAGKTKPATGFGGG